MDSIFETCSEKQRHSPPKLYLGRSKFNVVLYEHSSGNKWNVTYNDYARTGAVDDSTYSEFCLVVFVISRDMSLRSFLENGTFKF